MDSNEYYFPPYLHRHPDTTVINDHPRLKKVRNLYRKKLKANSETVKDSMSQIVQFLDRNIGFIYPNILYIAIPFNDATIKLFYGKERLKIIKNLSNEFIRIGFNKLIIDIKNSEILDTSIIDVLNAFFANAFTYKALICDDLAHKYVMPHLHHLNKFFFYSPEDAQFDFLRYHGNLLRVHAIALSGDITKNNVEGCFRRLGISSASYIDLIVLDLNRLRNLDLIASTMLLILCHSFAHKYGVLYKIIMPNYGSAKAELIESRFAKIMEPYMYEPLKSFAKVISEREEFTKLRGPRYGTIAFSPETYSNLLEIFIDTFESLMSSRNFLYTRYIRHFGNRIWQVLWKNLLSAMKELCDNVKEHANGTGYIAFLISKEGILQICICDVGIGLEKGLKDNYTFKIKSSDEAIIKALNLKKYMKYRKKDKRGGYGLNTVKKIVAGFGGEMSIRTGTSVVNFKYNSDDKELVIDSVKKGLIRLDGTQFFINVPLQKYGP
ncbi:MAG: ATP-binding protein [Thermodesulfovibrionales bacterium]